MHNKQLSENRVIYVDTETTDMGDKDQVIEITIINENGNVLMDSLVKPTVPVTEQAFNVHKITDEQLSTAPTWDQLYPKIKAIMANKVSIAWYCDFDERLINQTCSAYNLPPISTKWFCGKRYFSKHMDVWDKENDRLKRYRLTEAAEELVIDTDIIGGVAHRSLFDTKLTYLVLKNINFTLENL